MRRICHLHGYLFLLVIQIFFVIKANAVPAYPCKVKVKAGNGVTLLTLRGDENSKYGITEDGYTVIQDVNEIWYYVKEKEDADEVCISSFQLLPKAEESEELKAFLLQQRKGIVPRIYKSSNLCSPTTSEDMEFRKTFAVGERRVLVIMMQFRDAKLQKTRSQFDDLFNKEGYNDDGAMGSVRDYYDFVSYGKLQLHCDILGPYTASENMAYYGGNSVAGGNDKNPYALFKEAIEKAVEEVNLHDYDADGDGYVDNVHIIYAGYGEEAGASSNAIWAHEMTFQPITIGGMKIDGYSCSPELRGNSGDGISRIGPHCHELGHALGAMDYYDTDYDSGGYYLGTGDWDVMASGSWNNEGISPANFNPYVKIYDFGWTTAQNLEKDTINKIEPSAEEDNIYRVDTGTKNDFFLLEYRDGSYFDSAEPGKGLLIFHIGPKLESKAVSNTINSTYPQQCYIVCASSTYSRPSATSASYGKINSPGCPYPGSNNKTSFTNNTTPAALTVGGSKTDIKITDIKKGDGVIVLNYGSSNSGNPDTPDDPDEYDQYEDTWRDDFEDIKLSDFWGYRDILGMGNFGLERKIIGNDTPKSPNAISGRGYTSFQATVRNSIGRSHTKGCIEGKSISLDKNKDYSFRLAVRRYTKLEDSNDVLTLRFYTSSEVVERQFNILNNESWKVIEITLPANIESLRFEMEPDVDNGSIIFFDDVSVFGYSSSAIQSPQEHDDTKQYFNIRGEKITVDALHGLIISNGKKILVRE